MEGLERGADLATHRSKPVSPAAIEAADLLVVMDARQRRSVWERFGRGDALVLGDLDPLPVATRGVVDPVNGSRAAFAACYDRIDRCVEALVAALPATAAMNGHRNGARETAGIIAVPLTAPATDAALQALPLRARVAHHFTVDLEEYFQVRALEPCVPSSAWDRMESRVARSTIELLELLEKHDARATFFVVGWVARRHGNLIRAIAAAGHEIASHGWDHSRITRQGAEQLRVSVRRTKRLLEDLTSQPVLGFRAPDFSIVPGREWALDVLLEEGYCYDSSLFPIRRPGYGYPGSPPGPHRIQRAAGGLLEFPPATLRRFGVAVPAGGGAYFRLLPYGLATSALREFERRGEPATFYIHPWELDPEQPRLRTSWAVRVRHYGGLDRVSARLDRLLSEFRFTRISDTVAKHATFDFVSPHARTARSGNGAAAAR
jgi:polysaccharide deacetylase family protein (PEP-CTERM system associated)